MVFTSAKELMCSTLFHYILVGMSGNIAKRLFLTTFRVRIDLGLRNNRLDYGGDPKLDQDVMTSYLYFVFLL